MPRATDKTDRAQFVATARAIAEDLRATVGETGFRMRPTRQIRAISAETDGWMSSIGKAPGVNLWIEIWLDRYARHADRKFYAGFHSSKTNQVDKLARKASRSQGSPLKIADEDFEEVGQHLLLKRRFRREDFNRPLWERYRRREHCFYGFYDPVRRTRSVLDNRFKARAVDFIVEVAALHRTQPPQDIMHEVYPRFENRRLVGAHLARERSGYLAAERKRMDDFRCAICNRTFAGLYGEDLGEGFAEAHHIRPLRDAGDRVRTRIEDLITVCANCHRMLHKMSGQPADVRKLKKIVRRHRTGWK